MAHERETRPLKPEQIVPPNCSWQRLLDNDGGELEVTYRHTLEDLGTQKGVLGVVFSRRSHLDEFVACFRPGQARSTREESERFQRYAYDDLVARDKANLDLVWLRDASHEDADSLPPPEVLAREIVGDLKAALAEFAAVAEALEKTAAERGATL